MLGFAQIASILEVLAVVLSPGSKSKTMHRRISKHYPELCLRVSNFTHQEQINIWHQIMELRIYSSGGVHVLDPCVEHILIQHPDIPRGKARMLTAIHQQEHDQILWLKQLKDSDFRYSDVNFRHGFSRVYNQPGLLSSNPMFSVHLLEAWPQNLKGKAISVEHGQRKMRDDCHLICVKIAKSAKALKQLQCETAALQALQCTDCVVELHCLALTSAFLKRGMLVTRYHAVPPPQEQGFESSLSLMELEETCEEITLALTSLHSQGWAWLNLKHNHILLNVARHDERDQRTQLRILGLEHAITEESLQSIDFFPTVDPTWAAPELTLYSTSSVEQGKSVSDQTSVKSLCFFTQCDMYALGLLMFCYLARTIDPLHALRGVSTTESLSRSFNIPICDPSKRIQSDSYLIRIAMDLVERDPLLRPSAVEVLHRLRAGRSVSHVQLETFKKEIPAKIHGQTLQMLWPVFLESKIVPDQREKRRMTDYMSVFAAMDIPKGKLVADYNGRPVSKHYLRWLRHLGLHTHALNDGEEGAFDGRRKCNGIYDSSFYICNGKVVSIFQIRRPPCCNQLRKFCFPGWITCRQC
jgi:serine/threonine protein kinase